jgi:hypothetical protein
VIGATDFFLKKFNWNKNSTSSITFLFTLYKGNNKLYRCIIIIYLNAKNLSLESTSSSSSNCGLGYFKCSSRNGQCGDQKIKKSLLETFDIELLDVQTLNEDTQGKDASSGSEEKEDSKKTYRCIHQSLTCNGHNNCGQFCSVDEGDCDNFSGGNNGGKRKKS